MKRFLFTCLLAFGLCAGGILVGTHEAAAQGQSGDDLLDLFGEGVHQFNSGRYQQAVNTLTTVINAGTEDPRPYYFRGLAYRALGQSEQSTEDFKDGAALEAGNLSQRGQINRALIRIQGQIRAELETLRADARVNAQDRRLQEIRKRYEDLRRAEESVLLRQSRPSNQPQPVNPYEERPGDVLPAKPQASVDPEAALAGPDMKEPSPRTTPQPQQLAQPESPAPSARQPDDTQAGAGLGESDPGGFGGQLPQIPGGLGGIGNKPVRPAEPNEPAFPEPNLPLPAFPQPGDTQPGDTQPGDTQPGDTQPATEPEEKQAGFNNAKPGAAGRIFGAFFKPLERLGQTAEDAAEGASPLSGAAPSQPEFNQDNPRFEDGGFEDGGFEDGGFGGPEDSPTPPPAFGEPGF